MKQPMTAVMVLLCLLVFESSHANVSRLALPANAQAPAENRVLLDGAPWLAKGFGVSFERIILNRFTVGSRSSFFVIENAGDGFSASNQVQTYSLEGRFFFRQMANQSGWYGLLGARYVSVLFRGAFDGTLDGTTSASSLGPITGTGYQRLFGSTNESVRSFFNFGALYGRGYQVAASVQRIGNGPTRITDAQIHDGLFFEAAIGVLF